MKKLFIAASVLSALFVMGQEPATVQCKDCYGTGTKTYKSECPACHGAGYRADIYGRIIKCPRCSEFTFKRVTIGRRSYSVGTGVIKEQAKCDCCEGTGRVPNPKAPAPPVKTIELTQDQWKKIIAIVEINGEVELSRSKIKLVVK